MSFKFWISSSVNVLLSAIGLQLMVYTLFLVAIWVGIVDHIVYLLFFRDLRWLSLGKIIVVNIVLLKIILG